MHSLLTRANAVFAFTLSTLAAVTFACFLTTAIKDVSSVGVTLRSTKALVKSLPDYSVGRVQNDLGIVNYDVGVDLSSLFNWNVKQLFVYLVAEYSSGANKVNQVVLWDKIVLRTENAVVDIHSANAKYYFWDDGNGLRGNENVTLTLNWNVIPNAGYLPIGQGKGSYSFSFPQEYTTSKA